MTEPILPDLDPEEIEFNSLELPESMYSSLSGGKSTYSPEIRARAVFIATLLGTPHKAAKTLGVPLRTVYDWAKTDWWHEIETRLKNQAAKSLESKFSAIIRKAMEKVEDRLDRGDPKLDRNGEEVRQGVSAKDAALIMCQIFDKRALLRGDPTSRTERTTTARDRLKGLAQDMEKLAEPSVAKTATKVAVKATNVPDELKH